MATTPDPSPIDAPDAANTQDRREPSKPRDDAEAPSKHSDGHDEAAATPDIKLSSSLPKRKHSDASQTSPKRQRVNATAHEPPTLPPELWQYIFTFLPPEILARIQRVCRDFLHCLTAEPTNTEKKKGYAQPLYPDKIWAAARTLHHPTWPEPLSPMADLQFWTLALGRTCQFCKRLPRPLRDVNDPLAAGPGDDGVRIVWQFGIRTCGSCLRERVHTEVSLLLTDQSAFLQVLPFTFITSTFHVVSPSLIQNGLSIPPHVTLLKYFYKDHVSMAQTLLDQARVQGTTTAYAKELENIKNSRMQSAAEWERIDVARHLQSAQSPKSTPTTSPSKISPTPASPLAPQALTRRVSSVVTHGSKTPAPHRHQNSLSRNSRSMNDANEGKAARRSDIELRCGTLDPPIPSALLPHMESFQAAIQISNPLTEDAWNLLRPRLLAQRDAAEVRENERLANERSNAAENEERRKQDAAIKEAKEVTDRQWEESQEPLRLQLGGYADDFVRDYWANGQSVTVELLPKFAADLLISVRARYLSELAKDDTSTQSSKADSPSPPRGKLVLDSMRWIYDNKVKPWTEARKELFMCNGCDSLKFYAFDSVVQHYAAKHTEAFSIGHIVVHWQTAEWPEHPPFAPDPDAKKRHVQDSLFQTHTLSAPVNAPHLGSLGGYNSGMSPVPYGSPAYGQQHYPMGPFQAPGQFMVAERAQHNFSPSFPVGRGAYHAPATGYAGMQTASPFNSRPTYFAPGLSTPAPGNAPWGPPAYAQPQTYGHAAVPPPPPPPPASLYQTQLEEVAGVARETWGLVSNVRGLPQSVRVFCVISSVVSRFQQRFSNEPSLDLFTDCLINHKLMRPLKDASPLACKVCVDKNESREGSDSPSFPLSSGERKLYPFHSLLVHFKNVHIEHAMHGQDERRLDWKTDMIELPSDEYISKLSRVQGIDRAKMQLLVATFPNTSWATEGEAMVHDPVMGTISVASHSPSNSGFAGPGRSSAASHHTRASGIQSRGSGTFHLPPSSITSVNAVSPANADEEHKLRHPADDSASAAKQDQSSARDVDSPTGSRRSALPSGRLSRATSRVQGSRDAAEGNEESADRFLASLGGDTTHETKQDGHSVSGASARNQSPESRHSQPTEATLTSLRELGYVVIPPGAPEHYERQQAVPLRRHRQEGRSQPHSTRYQHHPYTRPANRDRGYSRGYYREDRQYFAPPRPSYGRYADYGDEYEERPRPMRPPYGVYQPEHEYDNGEGYEVMYMRRQDIPRYYEPDPADAYEDERERAIRRASERYSRPPVEYETEPEVPHDTARTTERDNVGSRGGSRAR